METHDLRQFTDIEEFFEALSECEYVILRDYEMLFTSGAFHLYKDMEILCSDKEQLLKALSCAPYAVFSYYQHSYLTVISGEKVKLDVYYVGDNYYDAVWEREMIKNRILNQGNVYVLDTIDEYYSLLYHALVHVRHRKDKLRRYMPRFEEMANQIGIGCSISITALEKYMKTHGYKYTYPNNPTRHAALGGVSREMVDKSTFNLSRYIRAKLLFWIGRAVPNKLFWGIRNVFLRISGRLREKCEK